MWDVQIQTRTPIYIVQCPWVKPQLEGGSVGTTDYNFGSILLLLPYDGF